VPVYRAKTFSVLSEIPSVLDRIENHDSRPLR